MGDRLTVFKPFTTLQTVLVDPLRLQLTVFVVPFN